MQSSIRAKRQRIESDHPSTTDVSYNDQQGKTGVHPSNDDNFLHSEGDKELYEVNDNNNNNDNSDNDDDSIDEDSPEDYLDPQLVINEDNSKDFISLGTSAATDTYDDLNWDTVDPDSLLTTTELGTANLTSSVLPSSSNPHGHAKDIPQDCATSVDFLELLLTDAVVETFVLKTNKYANAKRQGAWKALSIDELKKYFALVLYMSLVQRPTLEMYWEDGNLGDAFVKTTMRRLRFFEITHHLHWENTADLYTPEARQAKNKTDGLWSVNGFLQALSTNFKSYYQCGQCIHVNEMCIFMKGKHRCRCYNPVKVHPWHLKAYALLDSSSGYVWDFMMYRGKDDSAWSNHCPTTQLYPVKVLTDDPRLHGKNHVLATNDWCTSLDTLVEVTSAPKLMDFVGIVKADSKGLPSSSVMIRQQVSNGRSEQRGTMKSRKVKNENIYFTAWNDRTPVHILSSWQTKYSLVQQKIRDQNGNMSSVLVKRPTVITAYHRAMGKTSSNTNNILDSHTNNINDLGWRQQLIFHFLRVTCRNAMILKSQHQNNNNSNCNDNDNGNNNQGNSSDFVDFVKDIVQVWSTKKYHHTYSSTLFDVAMVDFAGTGTCFTVSTVHVPAMRPCDCPEDVIPCTRRHRRRCKSCNKGTRNYCTGCNLSVCGPLSGNKRCWGEVHAACDD